jgi:hypothetical protein
MLILIKFIYALTHIVKRVVPLIEIILMLLVWHQRKNSLQYLF